ncbi:hypothetical protein [Haloterrigena alkaliphila]|uniref:DUF4129 domain-containing protein n=1 Tax=Haloterrigena alkaliphila TaxID=2816475 RepID=A0A8A2VC07_9EURY|nr:hypothetical protein [Haloterrigena alkaliphila]QSW98247.1 hypothetical protein J0X25_12650 [Haloterrigena alkaliphila]
MNVAVVRALVLALLLVCLPLSAAGSGLAAAETAGVGDGDAEPAFGSVAQQESTDDDADNESNETVRHRNPDEYDENADEAQLERWLSGWMSSQLESGAIELSEGEYELASQYVDEEYHDRLGQYVDVAGETERAESFDDARSEQAEMTESVAEYEETREEYEAAREAGDEERARELARELETLAEEIDGSSRSVKTHYDAISEDENIDLRDAAAEIEAVNEAVQAEQEEIRDAEFVETELTVESATEEISFTDPMTASGRLETTDGTPVADEEIRLDVGNQTLRTETDATGSFEFEYRPISVPLSADSVSVEYVPENQSIYLGSETSVPVEIEQVEPTLTVSDVEPDTVAYGEPVTIGAELLVDGDRIDNVPLVVTLDGTALGLFESREGTIAGNPTIPADVPTGERELRVSLPFEGRALASAADSTTITVEETEPALSVSASRIGEREISVNGTLEAGGDGVQGQSIRLIADGTVLETMSTDGDGEFGGAVSIPEETATGDVQLVAVYDDEATNLARAEAATTVSFPAPGDSLVPTWAWLALGLVAVALGTGAYRYRSGSKSGEPEADRTDRDEPVSASDSTDSFDPSAARTLLARATEQASQGDPDTAVQSGYAAVRRILGPRIDARDSLTHWEFYRRYQDSESAADRSSDVLRDVTEGYERAAFEPGGVSEREAETVLEDARELCVEEPTRTDTAD